MGQGAAPSFATLRGAGSKHSGAGCGGRGGRLCGASQQGGAVLRAARATSTGAVSPASVERGDGQTKGSKGYAGRGVAGEQGLGGGCAGGPTRRQRRPHSQSRCALRGDISPGSPVLAFWPRPAPPNLRAEYTLLVPSRSMEGISMEEIKTQTIFERYLSFGIKYFKTRFLTSGRQTTKP